MVKAWFSLKRAAAVCVLLAAGLSCSAAVNAFELPLIPPKPEPQVFIEGEYTYALLYDGTAELRGCSAESEDVLFVPAEIAGHKVSAIGKGFLDEEDSFGTVVIPGTVYRIASEAVYMADVNSVVISPLTRAVPEDAFYTQRMYAAYLDYVRGLELSGLVPEDAGGMIKPVGDVFTVKCSPDSPAAEYAKMVGAETVLMKDYTGEPGDINCDGKLNNRDLKQLQSYIFCGGTEQLTPSYDVNGDGCVDGLDITRLRDFLAGLGVTVY